MTNICFISNFYLTYLWSTVSKSLNHKGFNIFWIVSNKHYYNYLLKEGVNENNLLYINREYVNKTADPVDNFQINELIYGDRVLNHEKKNGLAFLTNIQKPIYDFIAKNSISTIIGELTWAHELLVHRITKRRKELNCTFLCPAVTRIPNKRFVFFLDERQSQILELNKLPAEEIKSDSDFFKVEKPAYLQNNNKIISKNRSVKSRISKALRFLTGEKFDPKDPALIRSQWTRFKVRTLEECNKEAYRLFVKTTPFNEVSNSSYILFALHKQPEASVDVIGRYYENQRQVILNFWRILPPNWKIIIKEHTNAIGDRSIDFYNDLKSFPNIILVEAQTDSHELINRAQAVVSISGTIAYEAALLGKPSIILAPVFFRSLSFCKYISWRDIENINDLESFISEIKNKKDNRKEFSNYLLQNSFEGLMTDPYSMPQVLSEENISSLTTAIEIAVKNI